MNTPRTAPEQVSPPAPWWWHSLLASLREQWIFAALLGLVWCGETIMTLQYGTGSPVLLATSTAMAVLALWARRSPVRAGLLAAVAMILSTVVFRLFGLRSGPDLLWNVTFTENAAGALLVLYVFWKASRGRAVVVTATLAAACLFAVFVRTGVSFVMPPASVARTLGVGFLQLVLLVGTGMYLRAREPRAAETSMQGLLRRQWPVTAALCVLLFGQVASTDMPLFLPGGWVVLLSCIVMAGLAVFAPLRPFEASLLGAIALVLTTLLTRLLDITRSSFLLGAIPPTDIAAGMLLMAFVARYDAPRKALWGGCALVSSTIVSVLVMPREPPVRTPADVYPALFMGGILLVLSVGTGMYFRARDEDRAKSVRAAITDAQYTERMALARELHDVVAHHVTGIVVQSQAARVVAQKEPEAASAALERISTSGTEALTAMRRLVASMRGADPVGASGMTEHATSDLEADLEALVARAERTLPDNGHAARVELSVELTRRIPPEVARSGLRLVQESLTNVRKHAPDATLIHVAVEDTNTYLHVRVTDDGSDTAAHPVGGSGGYGLVGMRERIELLGGRFYTGPGEHVGWRVEAWLPLGEHEREEGHP
ncbi:signal transduction histidine kinase [Saccharopolyspora lacisalsi]|uniref:histidine kinase n=1 Tax=Halosaccharopolyspora lacisalsi TaxID=1000566 RepID=A0A839E6I8_9PSEU|nr:histidine kinase [Halosaccharopolyspora lacisalsi]MBA8827317.1 signal transduction histidine kinase [Halosaccharopolyspora lacisalsi]